MSVLSLQDLRPYRSYTIANIRKTMSMEQATRHVIEELTSQIEGRDRVEVAQRETWIKEDRAAFIHYRLARRPGWTSSDEVVDMANELVLITAHRSRLAIYCSEDWLRKKFLAVLREWAEDESPALWPVEPWRLEEALLRSYEQRTLWLSGIHRRTASKADNKVLSGIDLRYALDPLGDQSFSYTAARANAALGSTQENVGVAPRKSSVWVGMAKGWTEHRHTARTILELIAKAEESQKAILPVLAKPAPEGIDITQLEAPFDAAFIPPEHLDHGIDEAERQVAETLASLQVNPTLASNGRLQLKIQPAGDSVDHLLYHVLLDLSDTSGVKWAVELANEPTKSLHQIDEKVRFALQHRQGWLKVWFESGYVLSDRSLFLARHRDLHFSGWQWAMFDRYDLSKEKPSNLVAEAIGHDDSLFCWVVNDTTLPWTGHSGWLASNDGSMEIADFIHVDPEARMLTLVHVKGAGSSSVNRRVSVSSYEIVVGQAVKNLRHVDQELLAGGFTQSLDRRLKAAVWHDGEFLGHNGRVPMKQAIKDLGSGFHRQVVILQPHVRRTALESAHSATSDRVKLPAQQLDTLLLAARAACQSVGADFKVVGEDA